jgi:hypothetical protein
MNELSTAVLEQPQDGIAITETGAVPAVATFTSEQVGQPLWDGGVSEGLSTGHPEAESEIDARFAAIVADLESNVPEKLKEQLERRPVVKRNGGDTDGGWL